jgi:hypothetical protein
MLSISPFRQGVDLTEPDQRRTRTSRDPLMAALSEAASESVGAAVPVTTECRNYIIVMPDVKILMLATLDDGDQRVQDSDDGRAPAP